jgi:pimeloyl-ACP methyl ester carboxylesterase
MIMKTDTLKVPGATLYYEVRGSGPVLLLICGGVYDTAGYAGLAERLAGEYTVVTYDRRGNSRSPLDGEPAKQSIEVHGDDAFRVMSEVTDEPADVFGNSSGAMIGLELAARHPARVRTLVAHEPPCFDLLPDRDHWRALIQKVEATFQQEGPGAAGQVFRDGMGMSGGDDEDRAPGGSPQDPEMAEMLGRFAKNFVFFIGYEVPTFAGYVPDLAALQGVRVVSAAGETSEGEPPHRAALALAERLGTPPVLFPGDHGGFGADPDGFTARLGEVLGRP